VTGKATAETAENAEAIVFSYQHSNRGQSMVRLKPDTTANAKCSVRALTICARSAAPAFPAIRSQPDSEHECSVTAETIFGAGSAVAFQSQRDSKSENAA